MAEQKPSRAAYQREWRKRNPSNSRKYHETYMAKNRDRYLEMRRENYQRNREDRARELREMRSNNPGIYADTIRNWRAQNPGCSAAHTAVYKAIKKGDMERGPCCICGKHPTEAHHPDYCNQLDVVWLCHLHHRRLHADQRRENEG